MIMPLMRSMPTFTTRPTRAPHASPRPLTSPSMASAVERPLCTSETRVAGLFLDTIGFVLDNRRPAGGGVNASNEEWKTVGVSLQLVSLEVCRAWRESASVHLRVAEATPRWLWAGQNRSVRGGARDVDCDSASVHQRVAEATPRRLRMEQNLWAQDGSGAIDYRTTVTSAPADEINSGHDCEPASVHLRRLGGVGCCTAVKLASADRPGGVECSTSSVEERAEEGANNGGHSSFGIHRKPATDKINGGESSCGTNIAQAGTTNVFGRPATNAVISRVPVLHVKRVTWERSALDLCESFNGTLTVLAGVKSLTFGRLFDESLAGVMWPKNCNINRIVFGKHFNQPLSGTDWPPLLADVELGYWFDQDMNDVVWPETLRRLSFGERFNRPFNCWPVRLEAILFGEAFNQALTEVVFPPGLKKLLLKWDFNTSIYGVEFPDTVEHLEFRGVFDKPLPTVLPARLRKLILSTSFNQSIDDIQFPGRMKEVTFGFHFNQPIGRVKWADSIERIMFGFQFDQPLVDAEWPRYLRTLTFGHSFNQSLVGVRWPAAVQEISFGWQFKQPLAEVDWPPGLRSLTLGGNSPGQLEGVCAWPAGLTHLSLDGEFNQPLESISLPPTLRELHFGWRFNQAVHRVQWPRYLQTLTLGGSFNQPAASVVLPDRLENLAFYQNSGQVMEGLVFPKTLRRLTVGCGLPLDICALPPGVKICEYKYYSISKSAS